ETTSRRMANSAISSTDGRSTAMKATLAPAATARVSSAGSSSRADRLFTAQSDSAREAEMTNEAGYQNILLERRDAVGIITLNRPAALNALNAALIAELASALDDLEADPAISAIVL